MDDPFFGPPFVDVDEPRDGHRYVHGGFEGTDTRFSIYLPDGFDGRGLTFLQGGLGGWEHQAPMLRGLEIAADCGAYLVESNQGHFPNDMSGVRGDPSILNWRASAASARFARSLAEQHFGRTVHHAYVYGGSGGGLRSIACLENAPDVWDGAVPFMMGHGATFAFVMSVSAWAAPLVCPRLDVIDDAMDAGGSGDPYAALNADERDALRVLHRATYPRGGEFLFRPTPLWVLAMQTVLRADRSYVHDFWNERGYAGADGEAGVEARLIETKAVVRDVVAARDVAGYGAMSDDINVMQLLRRAPDAVAGLVLDADEPWRLLGARLTIGERSWLCTGEVDGVLLATLDPADFTEVRAGDEVVIDNRAFVAFSYFHRHLVEERYAGMRQFFSDGRPLHPQRTGVRGWLPSGRFDGKMIALHHTHDRECWPMNVDDYVARVEDPARFRLWWVRNASHFVPATPAGRTRLINYVGCFAQAVRDVIAWVEDGVEPAASVPYELDGEGALQVGTDGGAQPVVDVPAARVEVSAGEPVALGGDGEWDVDGTGTWAPRESHTYDRPGTYFATRRIVTGEGVRQIQALGRMRVVVR